VQTKDIALMSKAAIWSVLFAVIFRCSADPLDHWSWRDPLPPGDNLSAITTGNGQFVAVGDHGNIITSSDGTNWISRQIGTDIGFKSIAYGNGLFVAVGWDIIDSYDHGAIFISTNAIDWTPAINPEIIWGLQGVVYGNGKFVAIGLSGAILSSSDGINWLQSNDSSDCCSDLEAICYGNGQFVVQQGGGAIIISTNGTNNWVEYSGPPYGFWNVIFGNGLYVSSGAYGEISTSTNGIDWSNSDVSYPFRCIGFGNGQFIANDGEVSTDGVNWTPGSATVDGQLTGAVWNNNIFVAVGSSAFGTSIFTSLDGVEWNSTSSGNFNTMSKVVYAKGKFVAVGSSGSILTSSNGIIWVSQNSGTPNNLSAITYGNGLFVTVGASVWSGNGYSATILTSPEGINWTQATNLPATFPFANGLNGVAHRGGLFVAVGDGGTILTSPEGTNWVQQISGVGNSLYGIACGKNGRFVTVGESGGWDGNEYPDTILTSMDGTNWTSILHASGEWFLDVTYGDGQYLAVGESDILTSPDGFNWTNHPGAGQWLNSVTYGNGQFVAVGTSASIVSSTDGVNWVAHFSGTGKGLLGIAYGNGVFEAVGDVILESQPIIRLFPPVWLSTGSLQIKIEGEAGITNTIQASSDLFNWIDLTNMVFTNPTGIFVDPFATNYNQRFYRSRVFQ
jgi:hypothetical protein